MKKIVAILLGITLLLVFQTTVFAIAKKDGPEFQITSSGGFLTTSMAADGSFVIAWTRYVVSGSGWKQNVVAQRYDANGNSLGAELLISDDGGVPSVAMGQDGSFVITWTGYDASGSGIIFAQRYDSSGLPIGSTFQVNTSAIGNYFWWSGQFWPSVAVSQTGAFIITWQSWAQDGSGWGIFAQRYDAHGNPVGGEFQVNTTTTYDQTNPNVAISQDGSFVITWEGNSRSLSATDVFAQRYDGSGNSLSTEFQVNTESLGDQWQNNVAMAQDGSFIVTWVSFVSGSEEDVYAQLFDPEGNRVGKEFIAHIHTAGRQEPASVAMAQDGTFVITWMSRKRVKDGEYGDFDIFARRYKVNGAPDGPEILVNTDTYGDQGWPVVATTSDRFVITWLYNGISAQRFIVLGGGK